MRNCKDCRFWGHAYGWYRGPDNHNPDYRVCEAAYDASDGLPDSMAHVRDVMFTVDVDHECSSLVTGPDFGCTKFEDKDNQAHKPLPVRIDAEWIVNDQPSVRPPETAV